MSATEELDIYEAVVRAQLAKSPLPRGSRLFLFLNEGSRPRLAEHFPEYKTTVKAGSPGLPPRERWYFILLGVFSANTAKLTVQGRSGTLFVEMAKINGRWRELREYPAIT